MGRRVLVSRRSPLPYRPLALAALLLAPACVADAPDTASGPGGDGHAALACAECHDGPLADRGLAAVPAATCTASGCHDAGVPGQVVVGSVVFSHRDHLDAGEIPLGCAGCHRHDEGSEPVAATGATCGLCHHEELSGERPDDCRLCHADPAHVGTTSQSVAIPHEGLPWIEGGCLRCHYEVTHPVRAVSVQECASCHDDAESLTRESVGRTLHPDHTGVSCTACHEADNHRIESMSSAVTLECAACHAGEHGVEGTDPVRRTEACAPCHRDTHAPQQRLLLGVALQDARPAPHFSDGLTCGSCHAEAGEDGLVAPAGSEASARALGDACVDCHRPEYRTVLAWWREGVEDRTARVARYLESAAVAVGADAPGLVEARALLSEVREGAGAHNLPLTHRLFEEALARAGAAYRAEGRTPPSPPALGRPPREGLCTYCHYRVGEPGMTEEMDDAFHRAVMGR